MKSVLTCSAVFGVAAGIAALAAPAAAEQNSGIKTMEVLVFGTDPCPRSTESEVVVCRRMGEDERFRIPARLRTGGSRQEREAGVNKTRALEVAGRTGIMSCSAVGPAGHTGCLEQAINQAREEWREGADADTAPEQ